MLVSLVRVAGREYDLGNIVETYPLGHTVDALALPGQLCWLEITPHKYITERRMARIVISRGLQSAKAMSSATVFPTLSDVLRSDVY